VNSWKKLLQSRWFIAGLLFMVSSIALSYREIHELVAGRDAIAVRSRRYPVERKGLWGVETKSAVDYQFNDQDGNEHKGHDEVSADWQPPKNGPPMVRFLPDGSSRLADHHDWLGVAVFGIGVMFMIVARHQLLRPPRVNVSERKSKRKNKKWRNDLEVD
jgi:hypothetical protein